MPLTKLVLSNLSNRDTLNKSRSHIFPSILCPTLISVREFLDESLHSIDATEHLRQLRAIQGPGTHLAGHVLGSVTDISWVYHHTLHVPSPALCISDSYLVAKGQT